jgi:NCAIR mutase (PurE)-related protein
MTALPTSLRLELDPDRGRRTGIPEIVYAPGKSALQVVAAFRALLDAGVVPVIAARCSPEQVEALRSTIDDVAVTAGLVAARPVPRGGHRVAVVTAGTADQHVADEAGATLAAFGIEVRRIDDVGVAGVHRLLARTDELRAVDALIVVAGMEGALPSVVAGLVAAPIVAVPTSVGYGTALGGITPLFAMLTSCANGVSVVNIDGGFIAAMVVHRIISAREAREARSAREGA